LEEKGLAIKKKLNKNYTWR